MKGILALILVITTNYLSAQPTIQWVKTFGGSYFDEANSVIQTSDGGYIAAGITTSSNGDAVGNHGGFDFWVIKLSSAGALLWKKAFGGTLNDSAYDIIQTTDGGYLVVGSSASNNYDAWGNHGDVDGWVVKLSANGAIQWQKQLGGSNWEIFASVQQTTDNGYILCGTTDSSDGNVTENKGRLDWWVVKLAQNGTLQWQKTYGGSLDDYANAVKQTPDGGYIVVGEVGSSDGDVTDSRGNVDYWILKLDATGNIQWQKAYGSEGADVAEEVIITPDQGYVVAGYVGFRNSGDVIGHNELGLFDYWVIKLDSLGALLWQTAIGGTNPDWARDIAQSPNGDLFVVGATQSVDGDIFDNDGGAECWLVKLDFTGELLWQQTYGGSAPDRAYALDVTNDQGLIFAGYAWSSDGDFEGAGNKGRSDFLVVKLAPEFVSNIYTPDTPSIQISPNPVQNAAFIQVPTQENTITITISDVLGRTVLTKTINNRSELDTSQLLPGFYFVTAQDQEGRFYSGKLEKTP